MSFKLVIDESEKHNVWSRAVHILSSVDEKIRITLTDQEIILWAVNHTFTTLCQIRFEKTFFEILEFKPYDITFGDSGLQIITDSQGNDHRLYSFKINAKLLAMMSKKPDSETVTRFSIAINNTSACPETLINQLLVHVELDSLISKEYSVHFEPIKYDPIVINLKYKRKFVNAFGSSATPERPDGRMDPDLIEIFQTAEHELSTSLFNEELYSKSKTENELTEDDEINFISCNHGLIRNFVENCNVNVTDEMELKIGSKTMSLTAFTKSITDRSGGILKKAMRVSNIFVLSDLDLFCLFTVEGQKGVRQTDNKSSLKRLVFKAKDFKNFVSMGNVWNNLRGNSSNIISIWFCLPGDPIMMEMSKAGVKIELVEVTDGNRSSPGPQSMYAHGEASAENEYTSPPKRTTSGRMHDSNEEQGSSLKPLRHATILQHDDIIIRDTRLSPLKPSAIDIDESGERQTEKLQMKLSPRRLFIRDNSTELSTDISKDSETNLNNHIESTHDLPSKIKDMHALIPPERSDTTVGWGKRKVDAMSDEEDTTSNRQEDQRSILQREKRKYMKNDNENDENEKNEFGPTQVPTAKDIFD
ncbi:similar to Saccharomyces cerevisiae YPL194W DDC1 DNA damage checkpoint protein [Maudiozyma saulgeensis]|uniref:Similar to Saccharomyces cerevisiae YPL194W DDC1 DNA damage checkpoint protein n=1 Tax=Maudiozyma saulgeensis TaxID=1789683 RepID=A0A1X7R7C4_9SACH|nr:similar to Saccharomyces cerevisiae YPL194W DDC1 DNA damage checkpoint protein [Kazachstania saulgeensis]